MTNRISALTLLLILTTAGCSTLGGHDAVFAKEAKTNLERGDDALRKKNYAEAEQYFDYVRTKYPFLDASKEAEVRLGDVDFARDQFTEARDRYANFAKLHPTHPRADYASYRAALTHYKEMPSDFFLVPPAYEKDQTEIRAAAKAFEDFLRSYPISPNVKEAKKLLAELQIRLVKHELYAADFYAHRDRWKAVAGRLETVVQKYPGTGYDEEVLFRLHDTYLKLNDKQRADDALKRIINRFPGEPAASKAQQLLGSH